MLDNTLTIIRELPFGLCFSFIATELYNQIDFVQNILHVEGNIANKCK